MYIDCPFVSNASSRYGKHQTHRQKRSTNETCRPVANNERDVTDNVDQLRLPTYLRLFFFVQYFILSGHVR